MALSCSKKTVCVINYEKKEIIPLTNEENQSYHNQNNCDIC